MKGGFEPPYSGYEPDKLPVTSFHLLKWNKPPYTVRVWTKKKLSITLRTLVKGGFELPYSGYEPDKLPVTSFHLIKFLN